MSEYNNLKVLIDNNIYENNNQEITGDILNGVLKAMVNVLGDGYLYKGIATTTTNPNTPDAKVFYIAKGKGIYTHFGNIEVSEDEVVILYWDEEWHKASSGIASQEKLSELGTKVEEKAGRAELESLEDEVKRNMDDVISIINEKHPEVAEEGFFITDSDGNVYAKLTKEGFDIEKANPHLVKILKEAGLGGEMPNVAHVAEEGMHITDAGGNIHAQYNQDGFDVNKLAPHLIALLKEAGISPPNIAQVDEEGFFVVDADLNVYQRTDSNGTHAPNLVEFRIFEN